MAKRDDVIFRRINGRVVPIRRKPTQPSRGQRATSAAIKTAVGAGLLLGGAFGAGKFARFARKSQKAATFANPKGIRFADASAEQMFKATRLQAKRRRLVSVKSARFLKGAVSGTGAYIGIRGLEEGVSVGLNRELTEGEKAAIDVAAGALSASAATYAYRTGQGRKIGKLFRSLGL